MHGFHLEDFKKSMFEGVKCRAHGHTPVVCAICTEHHCPADTHRIYDENVCGDCAGRPRSQIVAILKQNPEVRKCVSDLIGTAKTIVDAVFTNQRLGILFAMARYIQSAVERLDPGWTSQLNKSIIEQLDDTTKQENRKERVIDALATGMETFFKPFLLTGVELGFIPLTPNYPNFAQLSKELVARYANVKSEGSLVMLMSTDSQPKSFERDNQLEKLRKVGKDLGWTVHDDEQDNWVMCLLDNAASKNFRNKVLGEDDDGKEAE